MSDLPQKRHKSGFRGPSPDVGKATQFQPGNRANPGGRPKSKPWLAEILAQIEKNPDAIKQVVDKAFKKARAGSLQHMRELMDRTDGPVQQSLKVSVTDELAERLEKARRRVKK